MMLMNSLVSVIIPCYNHGHYLPFAVRSVLAQTYPDWEAIIVDDGSTDHTRKVSAQFADPRIRCVYQENQGLSAARNTGIRHAQGEYMAFLDADDQWKPQFLQTCVEVLGTDDRLAGVYCRCCFMDQVGLVLPRIGGAVVADNAFRRRLLEGGFFPTHAALVRAEVVRKVGVFDAQLAGCGTEDWDLWLRISERHVMRGLDAPLARYRVYPGSMSTNAARMYANRMAVLTKHFGPPEGDPVAWPEEKRRIYGFAYRASSRGFLEQGQRDEAWRLLAQAVALWPDLLTQLDTFYEIVCGDQPKGYRGLAHLLDIDRNGKEMLRRLDALFATADEPVRAVRGAAYGNAYLALAMLTDHAGRWPQARNYLLQAARHDTGLLSTSFLRRLLKVFAGKRVVGLLKALHAPAASLHRTSSTADSTRVEN